MKAALKKELEALSPVEKSEVVEFLSVSFAREDEDEEISPELMAELDRRIAEDEANPDEAITMEEFRRLYMGDK